MFGNNIEWNNAGAQPMKQSLRIVVLHLLFLTACNFGTTLKGDDWLQFRGPNATGTANTNACLSFDPQVDRQWKIGLPGPGSSSPIVVGDRVFLSYYADYGRSKDNPGELTKLTRHALCVDRNSGKIIWDALIPTRVEEDAYQGFITEHGYASSSPVSDGQIVVFAFGKSGIAAFSINGDPLWQTSIGTQSDPLKWGDGSSPILYQDLVIYNAGNLDRSVIALKKATGEIAWRTADEDFKNSWATPILVHVDDHDELVLPFPGSIVGFSPTTGEVLWHANSPMTDSIYGTLVAHGTTVMAMGGRNQAAIAVRCGGKGDVTETHVAWTTRHQSSIGTPLVAADHLYWCSQGNAYCADCQTGQLVFKEPLAGGTKGHAFDYPSPILVGSQILIVYKTGRFSVFAANPKFQTALESTFVDVADRFNATPAVSGDQLFIRSDQSLFAFKLKPTTR